MRRSTAFVLAAAILVPLPQAALGAEPPATGDASATAGPKGAPFEMESFQLVLLMRAPTWKKLPDAEAKALQAAHIGHLTKMGEAGKAVVCGPFDQQHDPAFRGACLYAVKTPEEARDLASQDPTVVAGQLRVEVMTWWVGKGYMTFPKTPVPSRR
jgi:uncharacterized protein YciI